MKATHGLILGTAVSFLLALLLVSAPAFAADADCDGVDDVLDNCPAKWNPNQGDIDQDGLGNRCDPE